MEVSQSKNSRQFIIHYCSLFYSSHFAVHICHVPCELAYPALASVVPVIKTRASICHRLGEYSLRNQNISRGFHLQFRFHSQRSEFLLTRHSFISHVTAVFRTADCSKTYSPDTWITHVTRFSPVAAQKKTLHELPLSTNLLCERSIHSSFTDSWCVHILLLLHRDEVLMLWIIESRPFQFHLVVVADKATKVHFLFFCLQSNKNSVSSQLFLRGWVSLTCHDHIRTTVPSRQL